MCLMSPAFASKFFATSATWEALYWLRTVRKDLKRSNLSIIRIPEERREWSIFSKNWTKTLLTAAAAKSLQSCPTLCDPMDCSLPGSSLHGILQARVLEWVAISFSRGSSQSRDRTWVSCIPGRRFNLWATRKAAKKPLIVFDYCFGKEIKFKLSFYNKNKHVHCKN